MNFLKKISIKNKIIIIILFIAVFIVCIGFTVDIVNSLKTFKKEMTDNLSMHAKLIAEYSVTALIFDDKEGAMDILHKLDKIPSIVCGLLYTDKGDLYAEYTKNQDFDVSYTYRKGPEAYFYKNCIYISEPISYNNEVFGTVVLIASMKNLKIKFRNYLYTVVVIIITLLIITILLAYWFQKIVSKPILKLAGLTQEISNTEDYSIRIKKETEDEIGLLYDGFNTMINKIEERQNKMDKAEQELKLERENLERRVIERTKELEEAKEKAEESDKLKTSFLANMSHEIRTPLNVILGFSSFLIDCNIQKELREKYYELVKSSGKDLLNLIDDILDIAKIESNQLNVKKTKCSINPIIDETFIVFAHSLERGKDLKEIKAVKSIPDNEVDYLINTDPFKIRQIINNISDNAIKFTDQGYIEIGYSVDEKRSILIIFVKDTGIGIAKDKMDKIFHRFTKIEDDKTKLYRGTGLGLAIAIKLVELLGGKIWVESELDKGAAFYFSIPYLKKVKPEKKKLEENIEDIWVSLKNNVILVVEDVEKNFIYLREILRTYTEAEIIWAKNGLEAVKFCREIQEISIVLMDIQLPELNGIEATKQIKSFRKDLPIIAQTAYAMSEERKQSLEAGCDDFIAKPINRNELLRKISIHLINKD